MIDHLDDVLDATPTTLEELQDLPVIAEILSTCEVIDFED